MNQTRCWSFLLLVLLATVSAAAQESIIIRVADADTGEPLPGAALSVQTCNDRGCRSDAYTAGEDGTFEVKLPPGFHLGAVYAHADGLMPMHRDGRAFEDLKELTIALPKGESIGGTVRGPDGEPVEGANIHVTWTRPGWDELEVAEQMRQSRERVKSKEATPVAFNLIAESDEDGRWELGGLPAEVGSVRISVVHPTLQDALLSGDGEMFTSLLRKEHELTLTEGEIVAGRVVDPAGEPLEGVHVQVEAFSDSAPSQTTGTRGTFYFEGVDLERAKLKITAEGYATRYLMARDVAPNELVVLREAGTVWGTVIDSERNPVPTATVILQEPGATVMEATRTSTDAEGAFSIPSGKAGGDLTVLLRGYRAVRDIKAVPGETVNITLRPVLNVTGTVVDAESGKAVDKGVVLQGHVYPGDRMIWQRHGFTELADGGFTVRITEDRPLRLRVTADGYRPYETGLVDELVDEDGEVELDVKLIPAEPAVLQLTRPDGSPAGGAEVALAGPDDQVLIGADGFTSQTTSPRFSADVGGTVELPFLEPPYALIALGDEGIVISRVGPGETAPLTLQLQPWARVEGQVVEDGRPVPDAAISVRVAEFLLASGEASGLHERSEGGILSTNLSSTADTEGRYRMDRVPPGSVSVSRTRQVRRGQFVSHSYLVSHTLDLVPGQQAEVNLGGDAADVVGQLVLPDAITADEGEWTTEFARISPPRPRFMVPYPPDWNEMDDEAKVQWTTEWRESEEGVAALAAYREGMEAYERDQRPHLGVIVDKTGRIIGKDVPPGQWTLSLHIVEGGTLEISPKRLGVAELDFEVPEGAEGEVDIGDVVVTPVQQQ